MAAAASDSMETLSTTDILNATDLKQNTHKQTKKGVGYKLLKRQWKKEVRRQWVEAGMRRQNTSIEKKNYKTLDNVT